MVINTKFGPLDDSTLVRHEDADSVEYCLRGCAGAAHATGRAHGEGCFCEHNVHRSGWASMDGSNGAGVLGALGRPRFRLYPYGTFEDHRGVTWISDGGRYAQGAA